MPHSMYYISTYGDISTSTDSLGQTCYMPTDASFSGEFYPQLEMVVSSLSAQAPPTETFTPLPDPLRNKSVGIPIANSLTSFGVLPEMTTFEVIDILSERSKGFAFVIK